MTDHLALAFIAACVLLAVTPGPNMALIIANTTAHGLNAGFTTLGGSSLGLALLVAAAALGMNSILVFMSEWFDVLRWVGALYLVWLGSRQLWLVWKGGTTASAKPSPGGCFLQGLFVSLSNPKVLLFLSAFLPQFVDPTRDLAPQLAVLSVLFVTTLVTVDAGYTLAVARARASLATRHARTMDATAGVLLLAGGAVLAVARRPS